MCDRHNLRIVPTCVLGFTSGRPPAISSSRAAWEWIAAADGRGSLRELKLNRGAIHYIARSARLFKRYVKKQGYTPIPAKLKAKSTK